MSEGSEEFNPREFFDALRKSASVKTGAIMFGQAQIAYYDTLKQHMSEEEAYNMLAHTTEVMIRSIMGATPAILKVMLEIATTWEMFNKAVADSLGGKEVPGDGPSQ